MDDLRFSIRVLGLGSTSEALREGLRLLTREALEERAAEEIHRFYRDGAPLPDGVSSPSEDELTAADQIEW